MSFHDELDTHLRARFSLIVVSTVEEERAVEAIGEVCRTGSRDCVVWDLASGFKALRGSAPTGGSDPNSALETIARQAATTPTVFVLKDFHEFWDDIRVKRSLRNTAQALVMTRTSIVIVTTKSRVPVELSDQTVLMEFELPSAEELGDVLDLLARTPGLRNQLTTLGRQRLIQAAVGLTRSQAHRVFSKAIVGDGLLDDADIDLVNREKKLIIRESEALEFYAAHETPDDVGGLGVLKDWLRLRERSFSDEARRYGLPSPKGVALIGIPGTGKSLTAKMIAGLWHQPLLRLDVGSLFGSLVGESEERVRKALALAEKIAPCVMWIDELEKSLSTSGNDGGTSQRVFGTILTWMQDKEAPVFVVATANDVAALPPELLRRGRFDEVFFLDLPTREERRAILTVHLAKRRRVPEEFDLERLADVSEGYVGAELEQAVIDAMYVAFNQDRDVETKDVETAIANLVPLSRSQREQVEQLREWLTEGRAQSASFMGRDQAQRSFVPLDLRPS
jgi:AAA+ superfamily predicted ATPase